MFPRKNTSAQIFVRPVAPFPLLCVGVVGVVVVDVIAAVFCETFIFQQHPVLSSLSSINQKTSCPTHQSLSVVFVIYEFLATTHTHTHDDDVQVFGEALTGMGSRGVESGISVRIYVTVG